MVGRPKISDLAVRNGVRTALEKYFVDHPGVRKPELAERIDVSKQALYSYLAGKRTPSAEVLARLTRIPDLSIVVDGRKVASSDFPAKGRARAAVQQSLFPQPVSVSSDDHAFSARVKRGPAGSLQITVELRPAN